MRARSIPTPPSEALVVAATTLPPDTSVDPTAHERRATA
jgi:hypothetical protein